MIAPMSQKRYIVNNEFGIFIMMDYGRVEITNHVFNYNVKLSDRDWQRLIYIFDIETEKRRTQTENEVKISRIRKIKNGFIEELNNFTFDNIKNEVNSNNIDKTLSLILENPILATYIRRSKQINIVQVIDNIKVKAASLHLFNFVVGDH